MSDEAQMIRFWCRCGARLKAYPRDRGRTLTCPHCKSPVICPQQSTRAKDGAAPGPPSAPPPPAAEEPLSLAEEGADAYQVEGEGAEPAPEQAGPAVTAEVMCPRCGLPAAAGSLLCTHCGLNFQTGKTAEALRTPKRTVATGSFGEFCLALVTAFSYPFADLGNMIKIVWIVFLVNVVLVNVVALGVVLLMPPLGLVLLLAVAGYYGAYAINIIQMTLDGYDEPPVIPNLSAATLFVPVLWLATIAIVFGGPGGVATWAAAHNPRLAGLAVAAWAFAYLAAPMAVLVISGAGSIRPRVIKGIFVSLLRNPGHYLIFLALLALAGVAVQQIVGWLAFSLATTLGWIGRFAMQFIAMLIPLYTLAVYARMLGLFGRYRSEALDFGEGAKGGTHPGIGAVVIVGLFALITVGGYFGVAEVRERLKGSSEAPPRLTEPSPQAPAGPEAPARFPGPPDGAKEAP